MSKVKIIVVYNVRVEDKNAYKFNDKIQNTIIPNNLSAIRQFIWTYEIFECLAIRFFETISLKIS